MNYLSQFKIKISSRKLNVHYYRRILDLYIIKIKKENESFARGNRGRRNVQCRLQLSCPELINQPLSAPVICRAPHTAPLGGALTCPFSSPSIGGRLPPLPSRRRHRHRRHEGTRPLLRHRQEGQGYFLLLVSSLSSSSSL